MGRLVGFDRISVAYSCGIAWEVVSVFMMFGLYGKSHV
jgi:hypothetical protein